MSKNCLLIIDPQNDFCDEQNGALGVKGASEDMTNLSNFISKNNDEIENIIITLDSHNYYNIAHPYYWKDKNGDNPEPFTIINLEDIEKKKYLPVDSSKYNTVKNYARSLRLSNKNPICIWPPHCIIGTRGHNITNTLMPSLKEWEINNCKNIQYIIKGLNSDTEHYGAFEAEVQYNNDSSTIADMLLINKLSYYDSIYVSGEASSHCVAETVKQLLQLLRNNLLRADIYKKIIILQDTMSPVPGFEHIENDFFESMREKNIKICNSSDINNE